MKKALLVLLLLMVVGGGYIAAGPYITVAAIREGIADNDAEKLTENIDFPMLRQNIKDQLNASAKAESERNSENNIFSALMSGFKTKLIDNMVESMITPEGIANLMAGKKSLSPQEPTSAPSPSPSPSPSQERKDVFKDARFTYDSIDSFSIWIPNAKNGEMRLVLQRRGVTWKLVNMSLPQAKPN